MNSTIMVSQILATGSYLPERVVKNADLTQFPPDSLSLIEVKTGVIERRYACENQATSDLAAEAAALCLCRASIDATEIDGIILATSSPDQPIPATSSFVQAKLGAINAFAFDINGGCTGAIIALRIADTMIRTGVSKRILVLSSEVLSRIQNPSDFSTYPYFGDGAGAVLLAATDSPQKPYLTDSVLHADGRGADFIRLPAGGSRIPQSTPKDPRLQYMQMTGRAVFDFAIEKGSNVIDELCQLSGLDKTTLPHLVLHQANVNIISMIANKTGIPLERFELNLHRYGNTGAASTLIAFDELMSRNPQGLEGPCLIIGFGAGLTWGGLVIANP